jgi:hypothetical protein
MADNKLVLYMTPLPLYADDLKPDRQRQVPDRTSRMSLGRVLMLFACVLVATACGGPESTPDAAAQQINLATAPVTAACDQALASGVLSRTERTGMGIADPAGVVYGVVWPAGWYAQVTNGQAQLLDVQGGVVALEGERIQFGGGLGADNLFHVCPARVERL